MLRWSTVVIGALAVLGGAGLNTEREGDGPGECIDKADNDANGKFDCDDPACAGSPDCRTTSTPDATLQEDLCTSAGAIATAQLAHEAAFDSFIEARPSPRSLDELNTSPAAWTDRGGFAELGWRPDGAETRATYWAESEPPKFAAYAAARGEDGNLRCCVVSGTVGGAPSAPVRDAEACRASLHGFGREPTNTPNDGAKFVAVDTSFKECVRDVADCQRVSCLIANTGTSGGTAKVTATWTRRNGTQQQSSEQVWVPAGQTVRQGFRFTGVQGGTFVCSVRK